ncbi:DnaB domain protein helicase domain protein [Mizugakiibacter sediminis]|uniref:DNA 5'-3' helicase n=1 Tax=Mizugakiibacter sediminis TaxID=1475481 RepID=A0A0K8QQ46_9GAMM|nr:DnaB-like helicase C-terminal domain-containing protein [Mizugakiibacter sediminis]GAP66816.1 DnaB domain protein helicase domain protein [Mizugakiibacter sediminis]
MNAIHEVERALLATLMSRPGDCWGVDIAPEHFAVEQHADIFTEIRHLTGESQPADAVSVMEALSRAGRPELGTLALRIASDSMTTSQPVAYAQRIKAAWRLRSAKLIAQGLFEAQDDAMIDTAVEALMGLHAIEQRHEFSAREAVKAAFKSLQDAHDKGADADAVPTGLRDLDKLLGGLHPGDLVVIGARPAMGKTGLLIGMSRHAAAKGYPVGLISGEQPMEQVTARMLALASGVPASDFRRGIRQEEDWTRVTNAMTSTAQLPLWMLDRSSPSLAEVVRTARRWHHVHGIKGLYVDYLQRIEAEGERRFEVVGAAAKGLKNLARDLNIPVIVLAQVSREVEKRKPPEPRMGDLSDSSEIEKEADQVLMLYRPDYYEGDECERAGTAKIIVEKNRHGPTGYVEVAWHAQTMRFADLYENAA